MLCGWPLLFPVDFFFPFVYGGVHEDVDHPQRLQATIFYSIDSLVATVNNRRASSRARRKEKRYSVAKR